MATLQSIRNRAGLLVAIIIGLALVAFILGDILNTGSSLLRPSQMEVASINGTSVQYPDFQKRIEETAEIYKMNSGQTQLDDNTWTQIREQVWQEVVREIVMEDVFDDLGLTVTSEELFDLVQGSNIHPIIQQLFTNPNTGQVDKSAILQFLRSLEFGATAQQKAYWLYIEEQIKKDRVQTKYNNLIKQGLYVTTAEAEKSLAEKNKTANIQYISLPYSSMPDSAVKVTDAELKAYYNAHKDDYKQDKSRTIEYIVFPVTASGEDDANTRKWVEEAKDEFAAATENEAYINVNSDIRFENIYLKKEDLTEELGEFAFNGNIGDIYGPYKEGNAYKLAKVDDFKDLPDSVQASHILIRPETAGSYEAALALADSLKTVIEKGTKFETLAGTYSEDPGSAIKGGDLGWFRRNQMVKPFEDAAFNGDVNKLYVATTQFGVHLIQPTKKGKTVKQVRLAILARNVEPSTQTYQKIYAEASKFASENRNGKDFSNSVSAQSLTKKIARVGENDRQITGLEYSRSLVRAAYQSDVNDILVNNEGSTIFEFGNNFVIATLTEVFEEGYSSFEEARLRVDLAVRKENKAKALIEKMKAAASGTDLDAIAEKLGTEVRDVNGINFSMYSVPALGVEPAVVGTVAGMKQDEISAPVKGNNGVYLVKVVTVSEGTQTNVLAEKQTLTQSLGYRASFQAYEAQRKLAEIEDKRAKFY
ncbi:peptidylprolyl isomerase [Gaoshiqia sp. Z1-71]|uniref:peptidylprolyl isomerase n=1 Tax=Gaoshiqia hydrogeniformans TaxID=3290090 RepID=UPI003BF8FCB5